MEMLKWEFSFDVNQYQKDNNIFLRDEYNNIWPIIEAVGGGEYPVFTNYDAATPMSMSF